MHLKGKNKYIAVFCFISFVFLTITPLSIPALGQANSTLKCTILDINNQPIHRVKIQLKHKDSGRIFHLNSNKNGEFLSRDLPPGNYIMEFEKEGYKSFTHELELQPMAAREIEITLAAEETIDQKREDEAVSFFEKGLKLLEEKKDDEALQAFQKSIELKPNFVEAYLNAGILLFQQRKDVEAEQALLKVLEFQPENPNIHKMLADINFEQAKVLMQEKKMDEAFEELKQACGFNADHAYVNFLLGYIYSQKKMKDEAIKHFEAFLKLDPNSPQSETVKKLLEDLKNKQN